jgi:deoxyguanosine kinase
LNAGKKKAQAQYVAVEGVIGVGKTTLVKQLTQRFPAREIYEQFEDNPFLPDFYKDREAFAFSTQIFFLMSRFRQQQLLSQGDLFSNVTLSDYFFEKDHIFAKLTLKDHELRLYERLFEVLSVQCPTPDMVIYLHADHEIIMDRIAERGRAYELNMDPDYIRSVAAGYHSFFQSNSRFPVLSIDTTDIDFRTNSKAIDLVVRSINERKHSLESLSKSKDSHRNLPLPGLT